MRIGFVGTGAIAHAIVAGLSATNHGLQGISVSPRNADVAAGLAESYPLVRIASSNQDVIDNSDVVFLSVRPQVAREVLSELRFRAEVCVVSVIATYSISMVRALASPAEIVVRAIPLPSVADLRGPTAIYPANANVERLFKDLGYVLAVGSERELDAVSAISAEMASFFALLAAQQHWVMRRGLTETSARKYIGAFTYALAATAQDDAGKSFEQLIEEHTTPGGINEQLHRDIVEAGALRSHEAALERIMARIELTGAQSEAWAASET